MIEKVNPSHPDKVALKSLLNGEYNTKRGWYYASVYNRYKAKWSIEDIINKPIDVTKRSKNYGK